MGWNSTLRQESKIDEAKLTIPDDVDRQAVSKEGMNVFSYSPSFDPYGMQGPGPSYITSSFVCGGIRNDVIIIVIDKL